MTYQRDPDRRRPSDYLRRNDGGWAWLPILAGVAFVILFGYMLLAPDTTTEGPTNNQRTERPVTQPTPTPTPAPKQP